MPSKDNRQEYDLQIYRGADFAKDAWFKTKNQQGQKIPFDLTGYDAYAQIRPSENSAILTQEISCTMTPLEGKVHMEVICQHTAKIPKGIYFWDLKLVHEGGVSYYVYGKVFVEGRVTE